MNKRLENQNMMILATHSVMNINRSIWEGTPVIVAIMQEVAVNITAINKTRKITEDDITGATSDKNALEQNLIQCVYEISSALCVMAKRTGNNELCEKTDYTQRELQNAREAELVSNCESMAILARNYISELSDYSIDEASITKLEGLAQKMKEVIPAPRVSITERKTANIKLKELIENTCELLDEQLDRMVLRYKQSNPEFYADYINARHTIAHGIRHKKQDGQEVA